MKFVKPFTFADSKKYPSPNIRSALVGQLSNEVICISEISVYRYIGDLPGYISFF